MSSPAAVCPQCGASLPAGHQAALCPACLLKLGFESGVPAGPATAPYQPRFLVPTPEELAPRFPQLEILERIGCGGMGVVYRARQKELDRIVALKILRPDFSPDANFAERFQREARALARLNHPHIVTVHDFGRNDDLFYFVMEFIDGINLRQLEQTAQLAPAQALALVPQVCAALQYAHEQGVVHRDIKPENILITRDGRVKIADFGLAKLAGHTEANLTGMWQVMGTPHYMAPEQVEHPTEVDHRADIYSLGVVFYEMLTGELPLGRFPVPSRKAQIDVRLDDVVLRALEKEPERRYQHATDVQTDVEQIRQTPGKKAAPKDSRYVGFEQLDLGKLFGFGASATGASRYAGDPQIIRALVQSDLQLSSKALLILGSAELLVALPLLIFIPGLGLLTLPLGAVAVWTGLNLKHGENARASLIGCLLTLIPSLLWLLKLPFVIRALLVLRFQPARQAFVCVPWQESGAWLTIRDRYLIARDWFRRTAQNFWQACVTRIPSRTATEATFAAVREGAAQIPQRAAPAGQAVVATLQHPITRAFVGWLFWSIVWAVYCLVVVILGVEASELKPSILRPSYERLMTSVGAMIFLGWVLGEFILSRHALTVCTTRLSGQSPSRIAGPRTALLAAVTATGVMGILLLGIAAFDQSHRLSLWFRLPSPYAEPYADLGLVHLLFGLICGIAAVLLNWPMARWVTRGLLGVALLFPLVLAIVLPSSPAETSPLVLSLLPIALATPAILWGFWGTRVPRSASIVPLTPATTESTNGFSTPAPASSS